METAVQSTGAAASSSAERPRKKPKCEIDVAETLAERFDGKRKTAAEVAAKEAGRVSICTSEDTRFHSRFGCVELVSLSLRCAHRIRFLGFC